MFPLRSREKRRKPDLKLDQRFWELDNFYSCHQKPDLLIIDIREPGPFRGGPPKDIKSVPLTYHQGHIKVSLNLNIANVTTTEEISEEIIHGSHSAGGSFLDTLSHIIQSNFHILIVDYDGSSIPVFELVSETTFTQSNGTPLSFNKDRLHFLQGGYVALYSFKHTRALCADTKSILGTEEETEETEYSEVFPHLFVGGAVCSENHYNELNNRGVRHILNVSNIDTAPKGFEYQFFHASDDQTENLSRIFHQAADIIEHAENDGEGIFVHCQRGLSRSPTLVMAFLLLKKHMCLRAAYELIKEQRPNIGPRSNFMIELCEIEQDLIKKGVKLKGFPEKSEMKYSLPMQIYELNSMRCGTYKDGMAFLFGPRPKRENECVLM